MNNAMSEAIKDATRTAALANAAMFDRKRTAKYVEGAPHLCHPRVWELYAKLVLRVFKEARQYAEIPRILDLGAGEGTATLPFLELGAHVTAVDISESQLSTLVERCGQFDRLEVRQGEITAVVGQLEQGYDAVVLNSFLHHIPDYLSAIRQAVSVLRPHGQFFSFQDPLRYDTLDRATWLFSNLGYFSWRLFQGNYTQGLKTRLRRLRGIYIPGSKEDDAEYHVTRNGVDQNAIAELFESEAFACEVIPYFSTQNSVVQLLGTSLGTKNTFAIIAHRKTLTASS